ncbi:MAG TPA: hypothetical protein ENK71_01110 [Epsilonproteobacteria bacterium]|nr:hypothetical protein [Campylobacterota bacterium]
MLVENREKIKEVREKTVEILENLQISQKLVLQALEECDEKSYAQAKAPLKGIAQKVDEIDQLVIVILARYAPEARDLREMVAFLKITDSLLRIATNEKNYIKNMEICNPETAAEVKEVIDTSLSINKCTIKALKYTIEMIDETQDRERLKELANKIMVEASKTDDVYSMIEKDLLQKMNKDHILREEYINLMKYIRKNLKIIGRLEDIAERVIFARIGEAVSAQR